MIDAHAHPSFKDTQEIGKHEFVFAASVDESNWQELINLQSHCKQLKIGFGIHPWRVGSKKENTIRLKELEDRLKASPSAFVGEIGIDKSPKRKQSFERQLELFSGQLAIALRYQRPVVVHVVKAHNEAIKMLNTHKGKVYLHGFTGSPETMKQYNNIYFGINSMGLRSPKTQRAIAEMPETSILVESDDRPNLNALEETIDMIATLRNWSLEKTKIICTKNARSWLGIAK